MEKNWAAKRKIHIFRMFFVGTKEGKERRGREKKKLTQENNYLN